MPSSVGQLQHLGHVRLHVEDGLLRVDARRQQVEGGAQHVLAQAVRLLQRGEAVDVDHRVDAIVVLLEGHEVLDGPQEVADVLAAGAADARENATLLAHLSVLSD